MRVDYSPAAVHGVQQLMTVGDDNLFATTHNLSGGLVGAAIAAYITYKNKKLQKLAFFTVLGGFYLGNKIANNMFGS